MTTYKLLGEFIHYCSKCKLDLNHRITLMDGDQPAKVLCLTCKTQRTYRASKADKPTVKRLLRTPGNATTTSKASKISEESQWRAKLLDKNQTPTPYQATGSYALDQHVYHTVFGLGVVVGFVHPDKIRIFFDDGLKLLKGCAA